MHLNNYIARNMIFFVAALITTIVTITVSNNLVFSYRLSQDEKQRLKSINTVFKDSIPLLIQKEFSAFTFLSNTVYPDVAISFGLDNIFFDNLQKSGLISDNLIVGILDKKFSVRSLSKESSILKANISKYHRQNGITSGFNIIDNHLVLVRGIKIMDMGKDQGYLIGIIPNEWIKGLLKNSYLSKVYDFKYLDPSVDFSFSRRKKSEDPNSIFLDSVHVSVFFSSDHKKNASMSWTFVAMSLFISTIFVIVFGFFLKKSMEGPVNQILAYIKHTKNGSKKRPELPEDPIFRHIAITIRDLKSALRRSATFEGLARATQMFAHDVRKPFSMLQGTLDLMVIETKSDELKKIAKEALPEVNRAVSIVNGMIADVMEVGSEAKIKTEPSSLETFIENTIIDFFNYYKNTTIYIKYDLKHDRKLLVDRLRVSRVFANIVDNAIQAMKGKGNLFFCSRNIQQDGAAYIEIGIRNTGSYINDDDQKQLFDAFFTKSKKGGTGLGLAIARKIVKAHDGKIFCRSTREMGTEFVFTLPASAEYDVHRTLPESSDYIRLHHSYTSQGTPEETADEEFRIETDIIEADYDRKIKILIVEDEVLYQNILIRQLGKNKQLEEKIDLYLTKSGEEAVDMEKVNDYDVILIDVDLGNAKMNGFETVKALRSQGSDAVVCVNSNRGALEYGKIALSYGAQSFLPKPMVRTHLLKIIYSAVIRKISRKRMALSY